MRRMPATIHNPVQRDTVTFVETAGERTCLDVELAPGGGNPMHRHLTYAERFEAVEGTLSVQIGRRVLRLARGERATVPPGCRHRFFNDTGEPVRFRVELTPGHAGFERSLVVAYGLAADGLTDDTGTPRRLDHLALLADWSEMRACGPLAIFNPLVGLLARRARKRGVEDELFARYCGQDT
jgi:mannose-6-phosphate isomerase-like protein (cupin superfamily)